MGTVRIASIHFFPVELQRKYRGQPYILKAVKSEDEPVILEARDLVERDWGPIVPGTGRREEKKHLVTGEEIANDIVGEWTGKTTYGLGMNPMCHPGIWIVRERLPVIEKGQKMIGGEMITYEERMALDASGAMLFKDATPSERDQMWQEDLAHAMAADRAYGEWCWRQGNYISQAWKRSDRGAPVPREMPPIYRAAAKRYQLECDWLQEALPHKAKRCEACGYMDPGDNFVCEKCGNPTDMERWSEFMARKEAALKAARLIVANGGVAQQVA